MTRQVHVVTSITSGASERRDVGVVSAKPAKSQAAATLASSTACTDWPVALHNSALRYSCGSASTLHRRGRRRSTRAQDSSATLTPAITAAAASRAAKRSRRYTWPAVASTWKDGAAHSAAVSTAALRKPVQETAVGIQAPARSYCQNWYTTAASTANCMNASATASTPSPASATDRSATDASNATAHATKLRPCTDRRRAL